MSIVRWGTDGSDVYIYYCTDKLVSVLPNDRPGHYNLEKKEALALLRALRNEKLYIPSYVDEELMEEE